jgi:hypothetical protein
VAIGSAAVSKISLDLTPDQPRDLTPAKEEEEAPCVRERKT